MRRQIAVMLSHYALDCARWGDAGRQTGHHLLMQVLKKGPLRNAQQSGKGAGAVNAGPSTNASAPADAADPVAEHAGVGTAGEGEAAKPDSVSDADSDTASVTSSVGSADIKDEL